MSQPWKGAVVGLLCACGGGSDAPGTQPPPPPPSPVATSLAIHAGDGQSAASGATVSVPPAVIVRDQNGQPMGGVSVTFSIDSGGGAVTNPTGTTGTDGVASSGGWRLGIGRNRLRAVAGSLSPVTFIATGVGALTVADTSLGAGGGVVTVRRPGTPVDGLQLQLAAGAMPTTTRFTISYGDSTGVPARAGFRAVTPAITISTSEGVNLAHHPAILSLPGVVGAGELPVLLLFDRTSGAFVPMPTIATNGAFRAIISTLDGQSLEARPAFLGRAVSSSRTPAGIQVIIGAVSYAALTQPISIGYDPAKDDWEFDLELTNTGPAARYNVASALALTAGWYFAHERRRGALRGKYNQNASVEASNVLGMRLANMTALELDPVAVSSYSSALSTFATILSVPTDSLTLLAVKAHLYLTGQPYILYGENATNSTTAGTILVSGATGNVLDISTGSGASPVRKMTYANGAFSTVNFGLTESETRATTQNPLDRFFAAGPTAGVAAARLGALFSEFFAGTIAQGTPLVPTMEVVTREQRAVKDTLFIPDDTTRYWVECSGIGCVHGYPVTASFTPHNTVAGSHIWYSNNGSRTLTDFGKVTRGNGLKLTAATDSGTRLGLLLFMSGPPGTQTRSAYVDWAEFVIFPKRLVITPAPLDVPGGYPFTMTATYNRPTPPGAVWTWELGDGRTLTTPTNTLTTQYPAPPADVVYHVKVSMRANNVLEATGRADANVRVPRFTWRMQQATVQATTLPPGGIGSTDGDTAIQQLTAQAIANLTGGPTNTGLYVVGLANGGPGCTAGAYLQQHAAGQFSDTLITNQFPIAIVGLCGSTDPHYTGTLTLGTLGSGTLVGTAVGTNSVDTIVLPGGSINATMSGRTLTGTFVMNVRYSTGLGTYRVGFTATQVVP